MPSHFFRGKFLSRLSSLLSTLYSLMSLSTPASLRSLARNRSRSEYPQCSNRSPSAMILIPKTVGDLKIGMRVYVLGLPNRDGTVTALRIHIYYPKKTATTGT